MAVVLTVLNILNIGQFRLRYTNPPDERRALSTEAALIGIRRHVYISAAVVLDVDAELSETGRHPPFFRPELQHPAALFKGGGTHTSRVFAAGTSAITSLAYVLTIGDTRRFARSKQVVSYLGLIPASAAPAGNNTWVGSVNKAID